MTRHLRCCTFLWHVQNIVNGMHWGYIKTKFPSNLDYDGKIAKTGDHLSNHIKYKAQKTDVYKYHVTKPAIMKNQFD